MWTKWGGLNIFCAVWLLSTVSAGGAISNMYSVMIARYKFFPEVKTKGMAAAPRLVLFTSEHVSPRLSPYYWSLLSYHFSTVISILSESVISFYIVTDHHLFFQSHYSIKKASAALGFGTENLILLNTDERFAFIPNLHALSLAKGQISGCLLTVSFPEGESFLLIWKPK